MIRSLLTFILTILFILIIKKIATRQDWLSYPKKDRWHRRPVALYGGVGIVFGVYLSLFLPPYPSGRTLLFLLFSFFIFLIGFLDDTRPLSPSLKFILQIAISSLVIFSGAHIFITGRFLIDVFITYFWIIGITNAFNLLDNMDGLSAGIGVVVSISLYIFFLLMGNTNSFLLLLIASYGAYLVFNFPPAKIFMGDAGSLFLGFTLSILSIPGYLNTLPKGIFPFLSIFFIFSIPIFDTILVTLNRLYFGKRASQGGKDHTSHRLVLLGFSERLVDIVLYILSALGSFFGIYMYIAPGVGIFLATLYALFLIFFGRYLSRLDIYHTSPKGTLFAIEELLARLKANEIIMDVAIIGSAYYFAFFIHYEGIKKLYGDIYVSTLPFAIFISLFFLLLFGIYKKHKDMLYFDLVEEMILSIVLSDIGIKLFAHFLPKKDVKWEVLITYNLLWFFLFIFSRTIFAYFDYIIKRMRKR